MSQKQLAELLDKYLKGGCTREEISIIDQWYDSRPQESDHLVVFSPERQDALKTKILRNVLLKINQHQPKPYRISLFSYWWVKFAAAAIIVLVLKSVYTYYVAKKSDRGSIAEIEVVNNTKNLVKKVLEDKSVVWLNPGAELKYPKKFTGKFRTVYMNGECFFEVTKNPDRPFVINSAHLITKVWGTSFKVSDHKGDSTARVSVLTGKVSVQKNKNGLNERASPIGKEQIFLYPNQVAVFKKAQDKVISFKEPYIADLQMYKRINLVFENTRLSEIVAVLNEKFDSNIVIEDIKLEDDMMDADLTNLNLPEVLEVLKTSLQLDYETNGRSIILKKTAK